MMKLIEHESDKQMAIDILAKEYNHAPNVSWFIGSDYRKLHKFFRALTEDAIRRRGAFISSNGKGVLLFYNLSDKNFSVKGWLLKLKVLLFVVGIKNSIKLILLQIKQNKIRPAIGLYAQAFAIENLPIRFTTGIEVKRYVLEVQNECKLPVYAETTDPRLLKLYEAIGFKVYQQMNHPYGNLIIWFLKLSYGN